MRKVFQTALCAAVAASMLAACGSSEEATTTAAASAEETAAEGAEASAEGETTAELKKLDKLMVSFVPSREPEEIVTATEPLKQLLKDEMKNQGYDVGEVEISVGTSYEAVGEALTAGTTDVGLIPGGTYVLYQDGADVILTATRDGLSIDSDDPKVWNENKPTEASTDQVTYYRALMIAGPSEKGQELGAKVNAGEELTWDDLNSANWAVMNSSSSAGYIYPTIWLQDNYGKSITDLAHAVQSDSYGSSFARLASGQIDILCVYADGRRDYEDQWTSEFGRSASIWDETNVIGVTPGRTSRRPLPMHSSISLRPRRASRSLRSTATRDIRKQRLKTTRTRRRLRTSLRRCRPLTNRFGRNGQLRQIRQLPFFLILEGKV